MTERERGRGGAGSDERGGDAPREDDKSDSGGDFARRAARESDGGGEVGRAQGAGGGEADIAVEMGAHFGWVRTTRRWKRRDVVVVK